MRTFYRILFVLLFITTSLFSQELIKIVTYNVLNYPDNSFSRNPKLKLIIDEIDPDILVVQEIEGQNGVNSFRSNVLSTKFSSGIFIDGPDDDKAIFYRDSLIQFISNQAISTSLRDINEFTIVHKFTLDTLKIYGVHLKASSGSDNEQRRLNEVNRLRQVTEQLSNNIYYIVLGDFNIYSSSEPAYQRLLDQTSTGYVVDPINSAGGWHNNPAFSDIHTQSTRTDNIGDGGATGGLDDRFDQILISESINQSGGIDYVSGSYYAFGNDGNHFNDAINDGTNSAVSSAVADALHDASDHLPVVATFDFGLSTGIEEIDFLVSDFKLMQNYPNPFNPSTNITFSLPSRSSVKIRIYDILGREISVLFDGEKNSGLHKITWNASNYSAGLYFYSLEAVSLDNSKRFIETRKMILLK